MRRGLEARHVVPLALLAGLLSPIASAAEGPPGPAPWMAGVVYPRCDGLEEESDVICGGVLIEDGWVLTAAHCVGSVVEGLTEKQRYVSLKAWKRSAWLTVGEKSLEGAPRRRVQWVCRHREYEVNHLENDLALIKIQRSDAIPIAEGAVLSCREPTLYGWGTKCLGEPGESWRSLDLGLVAGDDCAAQQSTPTDFCTTKGASAGDSGGPLVATGEDGEPSLIGIAKKGCFGTVSVYERVAAHHEWIQRVTHLSRWQRKRRHRRYCSDFGRPVATPDSPIRLCKARPW